MGRHDNEFSGSDELQSNSRLIFGFSLHGLDSMDVVFDNGGAMKKSPNFLSETSLNSASSTQAHSESFLLLTDTPHLRCKTCKLDEIGINCISSFMHLIVLME